MDIRITQVLFFYNNIWLTLGFAYFHTENVNQVDRTVLSIIESSELQCSLRCNIHPECEQSGMINADGQFKCVLYGKEMSSPQPDSQVIVKAMKPMKINGSTKRNAAKSCKEIKLFHPKSKTGVYWLNGENPFKVVCEMDTDGGGWIVIGNITSTGIVSKTAEEMTFFATSSSSISNLYKAVEGTFLLDGIGLGKLKSNILFNQLRIYCHKPNPNRTFHIMTKLNTYGFDAVKLFYKENQAPPEACPSYDILDDDNSEIAHRCDQWLEGRWIANNKFDDRLYNHPFYVFNKYHVNVMKDTDHYRVECDDYLISNKHDTILGHWLYFVR